MTSETEDHFTIIDLLLVTQLEVSDVKHHRPQSLILYPVTMISKGLEGIVANTTRLSDVLGEKGQLIYAGYDINELAGKVTFEEVIFLLWNERLPKRAELDDLCRALRQPARAAPAGHRFLSAAPKDANPMDVVRTAVSMLGLVRRRPKVTTASPTTRAASR